MQMTAKFDLQRFVSAQDESGRYDQALTELRRGRKTSHWMWFVFPQLAGLGRSSMARRYAIGSLAEAQAYLAHPVLGARLRACASTLLGLDHSAAEDVFGGIDAVKLASSMTLFELAAPQETLFGAVLDRCCGGRRDSTTQQTVRNAG